MAQPQRRNHLPLRHGLQSASAGKKESGKGFGGLLVGAAGLLFVAYVSDVGGVKTMLDGFFSGADKTAHSHEAAISAGYLTVLPYLLGGVVLFLLYVFTPDFRKKKPSVRVTGDAMTMHEFAAAVGEYRVGPKVAREAYRLLQPMYGLKMRKAITEDLHSLGLEPANIAELHGKLLRATNRSGNGMGRFETMVQMMRNVEMREDQSAVDSGMRSTVAVG